MSAELTGRYRAERIVDALSEGESFRIEGIGQVMLWSGSYRLTGRAPLTREEAVELVAETSYDRVEEYRDCSWCRVYLPETHICDGALGSRCPNFEPYDPPG